MSREIIINDTFVELEDYDLKEVIGIGSFGFVLRAIEKETGKEVALKALPQTDRLNTKKDQANFFLKAIAPSLLGLPGIVKLIGFRFPLTKEIREDLAKKDPTKLKFSTIIKGKKFDLTGAIIVTELMKNGSVSAFVRDYLKNGGKVTNKINPTIRCKIIFGVAATMKRFHKKNIIHGDLKLEKIFLDDNMEPRIAYFGINKVTNIDMNMHFGVPIAIKPEFIMNGGKSYSTENDVFDFAFLIYKMFTNSIEFADKKPIRYPHHFMMKIDRGLRPKRPKFIPDPYWELIQKCWKQEPAERITFEEITEELKSDIFAINEFGMKTDLDQLHEYQERINKDEDFGRSTLKLVNDKNEKFILIETTDSATLKRKDRKTVFNWNRH